MNHDGGKNNEIKETSRQFIVTSGDMSPIIYPQEEASNIIASFVKFPIKIMFCEQVVFVGNASHAALLLNKIMNTS